MSKTIRLKRAYEAPEDGDGRRVLVERLWPRGVKKEAARLDGWLKEVAPSPELRKWYGHDVAKWAEFQRRYRAELDANGEAVGALLALCREGPVTLVFGSRDTEHNSAVVLKGYLERRLGRSGGA